MECNLVIIVVYKLSNYVNVITTNGLPTSTTLHEKIIIITGVYSPTPNICIDKPPSNSMHYCQENAT